MTGLFASTRLRWLGTFAALALVIDLSGCAATRGRRTPPPASGFLRDYSQLQPREGFDAQLVYVNPAADWSGYDAVLLDSVTLWADQETNRIAPEDRQMLADLLYRALHSELSKYFQVVDRPGAGAIRVRAALTQAQGAKVALRTVGTLVPQALVVSTVAGLATDTAATVGAAALEAEAADAITGERLAASVDSRAGTKALLTTRTFTKWGDVEAACEYWAQRAASFLVRSGVRTKPGAPALE